MIILKVIDWAIHAVGYFVVLGSLCMMAIDGYEDRKFREK